MGRPSVLIADDHPGVVERLAALLEGSFEVVGTASDADLLVESATRLCPDVIVTDISMHDTNALDVLEHLRSARPGLKIVVVSMHSDAEIVTEVIRSGAAGFVLKLLAAKELVTAINEALAGRVYVTPAIAKGVERLSGR